MKLRPFELGLVIVFVVMVMAALFLLGQYDGGTSGEPGSTLNVGKVTIWGTLPASAVNNALSELREEKRIYDGVSYQYFSPETFDDSLVTALADEVGPDLIIVPQEKLVELRNRINPVSYDTFPMRDIQNKYIDGAQVFALSDGFYAFPIAVDPLLLYWNRTLLTANGYLVPPDTWEALANDYLPRLILRDADRSIKRSVVAMGEYENVRNAFGIVSTLVMQSGSGMVRESVEGYEVGLHKTLIPTELKTNPLLTAVDFYSRFSKSNNSLYSWNRSLKEDRSRFISGNLVFYFGYYSEIPEVQNLNPNFEFDVAPMIQGQEATVKRTYGKFYGISLIKNSPNQSGASHIMYKLAGADVANKIAVDANMVPASREAVKAGSNDFYGRVAYQVAPITTGWLNPKYKATEQIFSDMLNDVNSNRRVSFEATKEAVTRLERTY